MSNEKEDFSHKLEDNEPPKKLPKLVKDIIDDYNYNQYIERENKSLEEMYIKCVNAIHSVCHAEVCCGYDLINGRRKYCMRMDIGRYNSTDIYSCEICHNPDKLYCIDHAKNKLFKVCQPWEPIVCNECIDKKYVEDNPDDPDDPDIVLITDLGIDPMIIPEDDLDGKLRLMRARSKKQSDTHYTLEELINQQ
jgi:hypothetical protein